MTLIEVLVASIILFMSLAVVSVVYQQNFDTQLRVKRYLASAEAFPSLMAAIRFELHQGKEKGELEIASKQFTWESELLEAKSEVNRISPETGMTERSGGALHLYHVVVQGKEFGFHQEFKQAVWLNKKA